MRSRARAAASGAEGSRGPYRERQKPEPEHDPQLDAIEARNTDAVPELEIRVDKKDGEISTVKCGTTGDGTTVYLQPYFIPKDETHRVKFVYFDEKKRNKQIAVKMVTFDFDVLSEIKTFHTKSAGSRWPDSNDRREEWRKWMLFVWQTITGEKLPREKTTAAIKEKRKIVHEQHDEEKPKAKIPRKVLQRNDSVIENDSDLNRPVKRQLAVWTAYNEEDFAIDNPAAVRNVRRAHRSLFKGDVHPSTGVLQAAYRERVKLGLRLCVMTDAWLQFQTSASGSVATVQIDLTDYAALARGGRLTAQRILTASNGSRGPEKGQGRYAAVPTNKVAIQVIQDWASRGRNFAEDGMEGVRLAKRVLEADVVSEYNSLYAGDAAFAMS